MCPYLMFVHRLVYMVLDKSWKNDNKILESFKPTVHIFFKLFFFPSYFQLTNFFVYSAISLLYISTMDAFVCVCNFQTCWYGFTSIRVKINRCLFCNVDNFRSSYMFSIYGYWYEIHEQKSNMVTFIMVRDSWLNCHSYVNPINIQLFA